jgi:hypothetical protein
MPTGIPRPGTNYHPRPRGDKNKILPVPVPVNTRGDFSSHPVPARGFYPHGVSVPVTRLSLVRAKRTNVNQNKILQNKKKRLWPQFCHSAVACFIIDVLFIYTSIMPVLTPRFYPLALQNVSQEFHP